MLQRNLFIPTQAKPPADEVSKNGKLLQQAGFVDKLHAGVYSWLPLGLRTLNRIATVIREEHDAYGASEVLMPALQPKVLWDETGRWGTLSEVMYQWQDGEKHVGLASTHEEVIVDLVRRSQPTYHDLPKGLYQIQWKFRNEPRAKSGVMRGREFLMKDLYSFHATAADLEAYYTGVHAVYQKIFSRLGLDAHITEASGGTFTKRNSHEFQVLSDAGEDRVLVCTECDFAQNAELGTPETCPQCGKPAAIQKSIEVGNTFNFGDYYGKTMGCTYTDTKGARQPLFVASYGIGVSRLVGTIAEVFGDERGLVWPAAIAPFKAHVLTIGKLSDSLRSQALHFDQQLPESILLDDRDMSPGHKFTDADLIGLPYRIVISARQGENVEVTTRATGEQRILTAADALKFLHTV
jgi:prolyl-tRNA synthetase